MHDNTPVTTANALGLAAARADIAAAKASCASCKTAHVILFPERRERVTPPLVVAAHERLRYDVGGAIEEFLHPRANTTRALNILIEALALSEVGGSL